MEEVMNNNNETVLHYFVFRTNIFSFWAKASYWLTNYNLVANKPTMFAFNSIPMGTTKITQPIRTIASVAISNKLHFDRLLLGSFCILSVPVVTTILSLLGIELTLQSSIEGMPFISMLIMGILGIFYS